jgi:amino acid permease
MEKIIYLSKKHFREILFALATAIFAFGMFLIEPAWCGILFFAEVIAGQILTRSLVNAQIRDPDSHSDTLPRAVFLTVLGFISLLCVFIRATYSEVDSISIFTRLCIGLFTAILFFLLYWMHTESDRKKYKAFMKMSCKEWQEEIRKIKKAEEDIQRAQEVLRNSPLY